MRSTARSSTTSSGSRRPRSWPPPTGPVFLSLPMDLMTDETDAPAPRTQGPSAQRPGIPGMADVTRACGLLAGARAPLIIAGDGVGRAPDGVAALTRLAEALGAR